MAAMFWGEVVAMAVYLLHRVPTKMVNSMMSYEAWHRRQLDIHHLHTFRCVVHIKATKLHLRKLEDHGLSVVFIGYERGAKAWHFYETAA
jgi:hypothetical protein